MPYRAAMTPPQAYPCANVHQPTVMGRLISQLPAQSAFSVDCPADAVFDALAVFTRHSQHKYLSPDSLYCQVLRVAKFWP